MNLSKIDKIFSSCGQGNSKIAFLVKFNDYEVMIESKKKFELDLNFLNVITGTKGILINKD